MIRDRVALEKAEDGVLAPFAVHSRMSKGRKHPEEEPSYRTCFQRDRDRIIHTSAFRRLEGRSHGRWVAMKTWWKPYAWRMTWVTHLLDIAERLCFPA